MGPEGNAILQQLEAVAAERRRRLADTALGARVQALKQWQHQRFQLTYADLLASQRYGEAARYFLGDLYGPGDFTRRDDQFARIVPALVRMLPDEVVQTVASMAELHALSERLDSAMGEALDAPRVDDAAYGRAWRAVGQAAGRHQQIGLIMALGRALERYTRMPLLRVSLRVMRAPARAAGLEALQSFLERGFETFGAMGGAGEFLATVERRERRFADGLFAGADPGTGVVAEAGGGGRGSD